MNKSSQPEQQDYNQPVAYDANGNPLYAHPPKQADHIQEKKPQVVHIARQTEPEKPQVSPELKKRHDESMKKYPFLNLSDGEYVVSAVRRHPIGLVLPIGLASIIIVLVLVVLSNYAALSEVVRMPSYGETLLFATVFSGLCALIAYVAVLVYRNNKFFLTNESVIQELQSTLLSRHEQTVSLADIEDASFRQDGFLAHTFGYGSIRLSTEGDETTYRFTFVAHPKKEIATLNNAVEAFKNGRAFTGQ